MGEEKEIPFGWFCYHEKTPPKTDLKKQARVTIALPVFLNQFLGGSFFWVVFVVCVCFFGTLQTRKERERDDEERDS